MIQNEIPLSELPMLTLFSNGSEEILSLSNKADNLNIVFSTTEKRDRSYLSLKTKPIYNRNN